MRNFLEFAHFSGDADRLMAWAKEEAAKDTAEYNKKVLKHRQYTARKNTDVVTNLEGVVREIININKQRWEIKENFRIMKTEVEAKIFNAVWSTAGFSL